VVFLVYFLFLYVLIWFFYSIGDLPGLLRAQPVFAFLGPGSLTGTLLTGPATLVSRLALWPCQAVDPPNDVLPGRRRSRVDRSHYLIIVRRRDRKRSATSAASCWQLFFVQRVVNEIIAASSARFPCQNVQCRNRSAPCWTTLVGNVLFSDAWSSLFCCQTVVLRLPGVVIQE